MKKLSQLLITLTGAVALGTGACSSNNNTPGGSGGSSGTGSGGTGGGTTTGTSDPLPSSATGFVDDPTTGVVGAWYSYGDSAGSAANTTSTDFADSDCAMAGFTMDQCSQIVAPIPGQPFVPTDMASSQMCTNGTAALVLDDAANPMGDYSALFGSGIGLDFNNPGADAGPKGDKDLSAYSGVEFDFSGQVIPAGDMRVNFPFTGMMGSNSPYWMGTGMGGANKASSPLTASHIVINWADVAGPSYLTGPPKFDPTHVQSIQFQVFTNTKTATPYNFCVANLALIPK
jgi:hypothetical protein